MIEQQKHSESIVLLTDFSDPAFQAAFQRYFTEIGVNVRDWTGLFREMNEGDNAAFVRTASDRTVLGFIQFCPIPFTSWFFEETCGFIREFWVSPEARGRGVGSGLLARAEDYFRGKGICTGILTTDTAAAFYLRHGYEKAPGCRAKNKDDVYVKRL